MPCYIFYGEKIFIIFCHAALGHLIPAFRKECIPRGKCINISRRRIMCDDLIAIISSFSAAFFCFLSFYREYKPEPFPSRHVVTLIAFFPWVSGAATCAVDMFSCQGSHACVPRHWLCDGERDCPNGSDELSTAGCGRTRGALCEGRQTLAFAVLTISHFLSLSQSLDS